MPSALQCNLADLSWTICSCLNEVYLWQIEKYWFTRSYLAFLILWEQFSSIPGIKSKYEKTVWDFFWSWRKEINRTPLYSLPLHVMSSALDCQPFLEHHKKSWWSFSNDEIIPNWWKCRYGNAVFFLQFGGRVSLALPQYSPVLPNFVTNINCYDHYSLLLNMKQDPDD